MTDAATEIKKAWNIIAVGPHSASHDGPASAPRTEAGPLPTPLHADYPGHRGWATGI
jgi:hypothetical protein